MRITFILLMAAISLSAFSQKKKKLTLEEQVAIGKQQEAEAKAKKEASMPYTLIGAHLPTFNVLTTKQQLYFDTSAPKDKPLILALFNPGCDHCLVAAKQFYDNLVRFRDATILFVTGNNLWGELQGFLELGKMDISQTDNFIVAAAHSDILKDIFESGGIPQVMIYNKDKILVKKFYQDINIDRVTYYMNK